MTISEGIILENSLIDSSLYEQQYFGLANILVTPSKVLTHPVIATLDHPLYAREGI